MRKPLPVILPHRKFLIMLSPYAAPGIKPVDLPFSVKYPNDIIKKICAYNGIDLNTIKKRNRQRQLVYTRQLCVYFLKNNTNLTWKNIAGLFGGQDHTTAIHSYTSIKNLLTYDEIVQRDVFKIGLTI